MKDMIVIVGVDDIHSRLVRDKIRARGGASEILDVRGFPQSIRLAFNEGFPWEGTLCLPDQTISLADIRGVYWYMYAGVGVSAMANPSDRAYFEAESEAAMGSFLRSAPCLQVNPPDAVMMHRHKGYQLNRIKSLGLRVPATLITNDPETVIQFYQSHKGQIICKPLATVGVAKRLAASDITMERLKLLCHGPVQLQEYIEGTDIRVHVVGEALFGNTIHSGQEIYKTDADMQIRPMDLSPEMSAACRRIADALNLKLTGIDGRLTPEGDVVFFEANPSPLFMIYEEKSGLPISDALVELLLTGTP